MSVWLKRGSMGMGIGRFWLQLFFSPRAWALSWHKGDCCWVYVEVGPLEIGWVA